MGIGASPYPAGCLFTWKDVGRMGVIIIKPIPSTLRNVGQMLSTVGNRIHNPTTQVFLVKFQISVALILDLRPLQY